MRDRRAPRIPRLLSVWTGFPLLIAALALVAPRRCLSRCKWCVTLVLVTPLGPLLYRVAYQPLAEASVLVLLIVSVAVHFAMVGLGLWFFGAEGSRTPPFSDARSTSAASRSAGRACWVVGSAAC